MVTIIGIDPGVTGAMAVRLPDGKMVIEDLPTAKTDGFNCIAPIEFSEIVRKYIEPGPNMNIVAYSEKTGTIPGNGVLAIKSVYECRGVIRTVLAMLRIPLIYVPPQAWRKFHGLPDKSDKEYSRGFALQRLPELAEQLKLKKHHNRAEAALIALYGYHKANAVS